MPLDFQETGESLVIQEISKLAYPTLEKAMGESFERAFTSARTQEGLQAVLGEIPPDQYSERRLVEQGIEFVKRVSKSLQGCEVRTFVWDQEGKERRVTTLEHKVVNDKGEASSVSVIEVIDLNGYHPEDGSCEVLEILFKNRSGEYKKMTDYLPPGVTMRLWPNNKENGKYIDGKTFYPVLREFSNLFLKLHEDTHAWQELGQGKILDEEVSSRQRLDMRARGYSVELRPEDYTVLQRMSKEEREAWAGAIRTLRQWRREGFDLYSGITDTELVEHADSSLCVYQEFYSKIEAGVRFAKKDF